MPQHTLTAFANDLEHLSGELLRMGGLAEVMVSDATLALVQGDLDACQKVVERDDEIDQLQDEIEKSILRLLALRQPMAHDLRAVVTALKVSTDLERVGDLAKNVAKRSIAIGDLDVLPAKTGLSRMSQAVTLQLKRVLDAYAGNDSDAAYAVWLHDEEIDEHYNSMFREVLTYMMEDPRKISVCTHLLFIAKNLERVGDHCTNIAEVVYFLVTGEALSNDRPKVHEFDSGL